MTSPTVDTAVESSPSDDNDLLFAALTSEVDRGVEDFGSVLAADMPDAGQTPATDAATDAPADGSPAPDAPSATDPSPTDAAEPNTPDPFAELAKGAAPLAYKVAGESRTFDGILEIAGKGALIPADKLGDVRNMLARYESNAESNRELYAEKQRYDALGGFDGIQQKLELSEQVNAAALHIMEAIKTNPLQFVAVENGQVVPNAHAIEMLRKESLLAANEAKWHYRSERETRQQTFAQEASETQVRESALPSALGRFREVYPNLTAEDFKAAESVFAPIKDALVFKATAEQALALGAKPGQMMIDLPKMQPWFAERAAWRAQQVATQTKRDAAAKENAARTAQTPLPPRKPNGTFTAPKPAAKSAQKLSIGQLKRLTLAGKPIPGDDDYVDA